MEVVYYKFKCYKGGLRSLPIVGRFISVSDFKAQIFASNYYGHGKDFDILITDLKTDQSFAEDSLIPAYSSVMIRRVSGLPRLPIVVGDEKLSNIENNNNHLSLKVLKEHEESFDFYDFGADVSREDKINVEFKSLPEKSFEKAQIQIQLPQGYVCHRCKVAGHYIQHCPTNGDPNFDFPKVIAIGIPTTSVSSSNSSGVTYASASASTSSSHNSVGPNIAPELYCPLCKKVMKDAALTKCCFASFCDKCIRDRIVSNSDCVCQRKIVTDDILPNMTLRQIINQILKVNQSENAECKRKHQVIAENEADFARKRQRKIHI